MSNIKNMLRKSGMVSTFGTSPQVANEEGVAGELSALKPQNLLPVLTDFARDWTLFRFYQTLPKKEFENNVLTYKQKVSRTDRKTSGFVGETERGTVADSTYTSKTADMKYIRQIRQISDVAVNTYLSQNLDPTTLQIEDAIKDVLDICNSGIIFGDSDVNPKSFNGIIKQQKDWLGTLANWYDSNFVIDLRGESLDITQVNNGAKVIMDEGFGSATDIFVSTSIKTDLENNFYNKGITRVMADGGKVIEGYQIDQMQTTTGKVNIQPEIALLAKGGIAQATTKDTNGAPAGVTGLVVTTVADADSKFDLPANGDADGLGDYLYGVRGVNHLGQGDLVVATLPTTVAAGEAVNITFTDLAPTNLATGYVVYRSKKGDTGAGALLYPLFEVGRVGFENNGYDGGAAGNILDKNRFLDGGEYAFLVENGSEVWEEYTMKNYGMALEWYSKNSPARELSISRAETPLLYHPYRMITFINVNPDVPTPNN
jgi:hypothetical protein